MATKAETVAIVQETLSKFYCDICSKGYANVAQWEEHLLSYGHNHAKRKKEVAAQSRSIRNNADEINKRREKEKKREQKELERILKATGGGLPANSGPSGSGAPPLSAAVKPPAVPPAEKKKGGFFKVSGAPMPPPSVPTQPLPPPLSDANIPPHPPPSDENPPPPPPPPATTSLADSAPRFTSSKSSNLKSTWTTWQPPPPTITPTIPAPPPSFSSNAASGPSRTWKPTSAPALHPLLAGDMTSSSPSSRNPQEASKSGRWQAPPRDQRNDFFNREEARSDSPYELPTSASSVNTTRLAKGMSFVSAGASSRPASTSSAPSVNVPPKAPGISLAGNAPARRKALDMMADDDEDGEDMSGMPLPTGRPKARMPGPPGKIGFGNIGRR